MKDFNNAEKKVIYAIINNYMNKIPNPGFGYMISREDFYDGLIELLAKGVLVIDQDKNGDVGIYSVEHLGVPIKEKTYFNKLKGKYNEMLEMCGGNKK